MNKVKIITSVVLIVGLGFALFFTEKVEERQMITEWERPKTLSSIAWECEELIETEQIEELKGWAIDKEVVILVATSGDTGKAALDGFSDVAGTRINVFYPENGVSNIQKLQMITQKGNNVNVVAVKGNFDDAQNGVKQIFTDTDFIEMADNNNLILSSANSINWGRLVPQIIYYFSAYASMVEAGEINAGDKINIVVPTGNFGNILAAYYAKKMGLFVNKLICASNSNNVLTEFLNTGVYDRNRDFKCTISPSMDILISSNLERLLYDMSGADDKLINEYMTKLKNEGSYKISDDMLKDIKDTFYADFADEDETKNTIFNTNNKYSYVLDTHTAVAKCVYDKYVKDTNDNTKTVIASTASPFKFGASVLGSIIKDEEKVLNMDEFDVLYELSEKSSMKLPKSLLELKQAPVIYDISCEKDEMKQMVKDFLRI